MLANLRLDEVVFDTKPMNYKILIFQHQMISGQGLILEVILPEKISKIICKYKF